jgi:subfamily B ATP-binding cassette protein MsbA
VTDYRRLARYLRPYAGRLVAALVASAVIGLSTTALTSLLIPITDQVLGTRGDAGRKLDALRLLERFVDPGALAAWTGGGLRAFTLVPAALLALFLLRGLAMYFASYYALWVGHRVVIDLRGDLYEALQRQSLTFFSRHPTGLLISRITNDVDRIKVTMSRQLSDAARLLLTLVAMTAYVFYLHWRLAAVCLVVVPAVAVPVVRFGRRLKKVSRRSQERMADISNILHETITGVRIVKGFGMEAFEIVRFREALARLLRFDLKAARTLSLAPPVLELIGAAVGALLLWHAGSAIASGSLDQGVFVTFLAGLAVLYTHINKLSKIYNEFSQAMAATRRVFEVLDAEVDVVEAPSARALPPFRREIRFEGVRFAYDGEPVLRGIDMTVAAGEVVALVGPSGGGKSTLVNLLPRFYDAGAGRVTIDGIDVRDLTFRSLRGQIGIVTQEIILFDDTVRANIAYGRADADRAAVEAAARAAFAHEFVEALPRGYDTVLGERGGRLSAGQRQRISIARALFKDAPILILDEATSALDTESEALVQRAIQNLMKGRTTFVIAHRLSTVRQADRIYVLDAGRIVEAGSHAELLARGGLYAQLHRMELREDESRARPAGG